MKKITLFILIILLTGCDYYVVDCDKYPGATACQTESSGIVEQPVIIEAPEPIDCVEQPGHAECITPFSELKSHQQISISLPDWGVYGEYSNGFFNTHTAVNLYLSSDQDSYDYKSIGIRMAETYHRYADAYNEYEGIVNIKTINDNPAEKHFLDQELYELIKFGIDNYDISKGYFDISIGPVSSIWHEERIDCKESQFVPAFCDLPSLEELEEASQYIGIENIVLNEEEMSIQMQEGMMLDLGGVAKGYFVEKYAERLASEGVRAFIINSGGNVKTYGVKPSNENYVIAIQDPTVPRGEGALEYKLSLPGGYAAVSSGDQENFFIVDEVRYHHIINPYTLWPDHYSRQVTIVTTDSRAADILSTTTYVMPIEEGVEYINSIQNVEALWVDFDGSIYMSDGFMDFVLEE